MTDGRAASTAQVSRRVTCMPGKGKTTVRGLRLQVDRSHRTRSDCRPGSWFLSFVVLTQRDRVV